MRKRLHILDVSSPSEHYNRTVQITFEAGRRQHAQIMTSKCSCPLPRRHQPETRYASAAFKTQQFKLKNRGKTAGVSGPALELRCRSSDRTARGHADSATPTGAGAAAGAAVPTAGGLCGRCLHATFEMMSALLLPFSHDKAARLASSCL